MKQDINYMVDIKQDINYGRYEARYKRKGV